MVVAIDQELGERRRAVLGEARHRDVRQSVDLPAVVPGEEGPEDRRIDGVDDGTALAVVEEHGCGAVKVRRLPSGIRCGDAARLAELERELGPNGDVLGFGPGDLPLGRDRRDNDRRVRRDRDQGSTGAAATKPLNPGGEDQGGIDREPLEGQIVAPFIDSPAGEKTVSNRGVATFSKAVLDRGLVGIAPANFGPGAPPTRAA